MALLPFPSDANNRLGLIVNSYKNQQTGAIPQSLEDGDVTNASSSMYWFNDTAQYIDVNFNAEVNIWRYPIEGYSGYTGKLKIQVWNGVSFVDFPQTESILTSELKWTKIFSNIPKGRYKFVWESGTYRADAEWFVERVIKNKILLSSGDGDVKSVSSKMVTVPTMTSATTPSGIVSTNITPINATFPYQAFDRQTSTFFHTNANITTAWLAYEFPSKVIIRKYSLESQSSYNGRAPKNWTFEGSNDGSSWTILDTRINQTFANGVKNNYSFSNDTSYKIYRINITANNGEAYLSFSEMEMIGEHPPTLSILGVKTPSEGDYINKGMDEGILNFKSKISNIKYIKTNSSALNSGKTFEHTIDMSKRRVDKITLG
ncbi:discoidin domain-containing protein [Paenibacillus sp. O199]|uniref:discoidin domain-containing protein n=1 Tax=Paenibacillus sp. O199 TaxID=1643925 RepID=UPI0007BFEA82|nr:discoidin domain-containing protein [Paenibacillus sp. O199]